MSENTHSEMQDLKLRFHDFLDKFRLDNPPPEASKRARGHARKAKRRFDRMKELIDCEKRMSEM